ncbi:hypothetical protein [Streptomyces parvus]|uniref:hypothetical protein n=1 Tax=Streptomyces parvus TaxID=66428 RepID=UPI0033F3B136
MIGIVIEHNRVYGTTAYVNAHHGWVEATLWRHGFEWSYVRNEWTAPGTRAWPFDPFKFAKVTSELRSHGFPVKLVVDNSRPEVDPVEYSVMELLGLAHAVQRLGAALRQDMQTQPTLVTAERRKQAQEAAEAAEARILEAERQPGVQEHPEMRNVWHLFDQGARDVGLPPF